MSSSPASISLHQVTADVSDFFALREIDLELLPGHVHILMGENGSGKSSLINVITGNLPIRQGTISIEGKPVNIDSPGKAKDLGIAATYQFASLFQNLTVAENIYLDHLPRRKRWLHPIDWQQIFCDAEKLLDQLGFSIPVRTRVVNLNMAERQLIEIARAYVSNARIMVFDEPTSAFTDRETQMLFNIIAEFKKKQTAILYITHRMEEVRRIGDELTILRDGKITFSGNVHDLQAPAIINKMSGLSYRERYPKLKIALGEEVLRVENLNFQDVLHNIAFKLQRREILGITGLVGSGRTMIAKCIFGEKRPDQLNLYIDGKPVQINSPADAINQGIGFVSEDRYEDGLFTNLNIPINITSPSFALNEAKQLINKARESATAANYVRKLMIRTHSLFDKVTSLSGGNQQKVLLAKWIYSRADILILDEPTRGIDIASKVDLYNILNEMLRRDVSIILISSDIDEIVGMCDNILVLYGGEIAAVIPRSESSREKVMYYATGGHLSEEAP
jgi:ABC-type sugar transport system ATPase subunit